MCIFVYFISAILNMLVSCQCKYILNKYTYIKNHKKAKTSEHFEHIPIDCCYENQIKGSFSNVCYRTLFF